VSTEVTLDSADFESVARVELDLPWEEVRSVPYAIQLSANKRLEWKFGKLIPAWIERFALPPELRLDRDPKRLLSVHIQAAEKVRLFAGISPIEENLSPWSRGVCRIPREKEAVSRAESKLSEALELLGCLRVGKALDLGAAPGGWTRVLAGRGYQVDAVDPADLSPVVENLPEVRHHQTTAGDFLLENDSCYDLVVSDMKMAPLMVADLLVDIQDRVSVGGTVVATLKLGKKGNPLPTLEKALQKIGRAYTVVQTRQLYFNRHEVTVIARPRLG
jgi:23S rRNA C2498 (ribose-2'-O)-methylase RlmM